MSIVHAHPVHETIILFCAGMEEMILEEVQQFISFLKPLAVGGANHQPLDMSSQFNLPILNALWRVTVGDRLEYTDPQLLNIVQRMGEFLSKLGNPATVLALTQPWVFKEEFIIWKIPLTPFTPTMYLNFVWGINKTHTSPPQPRYISAFVQLIS